MGSVFSSSTSSAVACDDEENANVNRSSRSENGCCSCLQGMLHALLNKHGSKESSAKNSLKKLSGKEGCGVESAFCPSEDYDNECPICLEEFTLDNPMISTQCAHGYHLGCLYEWEKRSTSCPVCGNVMMFEEMV